jgi:hypothetical protein
MLNQGMLAPPPVKPWGRAKQGATTYYSLPGVSVSSVSLSSPAGDTDVYSPIYVSTPIVVDQLAFEVGILVAGGNARIGLYAADTDWQPVGAPLADSGNISIATTGVKTYTPATPIALAPGRYVTVYNQSDTTFTANIRNLIGSVAFANVDTAIGATPSHSLLSIARAYAAFPTPGALWTTPSPTATAPANKVLLRISQP